MNNWLNHKFDDKNSESVSILDEAPLWSIPFGMKILEEFPLAKNMKVLDLCCGTGFLSVELAQRLGNTSTIFAVDIWQEAIKRLELKKKIMKLENIDVRIVDAQSLPFEDNFFDVVISNNGLNNLDDFYKGLNECKRVLKNDGMLLLTQNLPNTFIEFYELYENLLDKLDKHQEINKLKEHITQKRKSVYEIEESLAQIGFAIERSYEDSFDYCFVDAQAFFNHFLIKSFFLPSWKEILLPKSRELIFGLLANEIDAESEKYGEFTVSVPFVYMECSTNN